MPGFTRRRVHNVNAKYPDSLEVHLLRALVGVCVPTAASKHARTHTHTRTRTRTHTHTHTTTHTHNHTRAHARTTPPPPTHTHRPEGANPNLGCLNQQPIFRVDRPGTYPTVHNTLATSPRQPSRSTPESSSRNAAPWISHVNTDAASGCMYRQLTPRA